MNEPRSPEKINRLLKSIAFASAVMAFVMCMLILVNYLQLKNSDPLNAKTLKVLSERFANDPANEQLREEIRELDLISRKAFFTSRWQIRTGSYLLLFCVLITIICLKTIEQRTPAQPLLPDSEPPELWDIRQLNRRWVAYTGVSLVLVSLLFAWLTHNELGETLRKTALSVKPVSDTASAKPGAVVQDTSAAADSLTSASPDSLAAASLTDGYPSQQEINAAWTCFRGPGGNGISFQKSNPVNWDGRNGKNILWKSPLPLTGYNSPVIWMDKIFLSGASPAKREVFCYDLNTGKLLWSTPVENIPGSPASSPRVNAETGLAAPTLATDGRRVYAVFANGDLIALDLQGKKVWAKNLGLPKNHYGHSSSLILYHDILIVQYDQSGSTSVMAFAGKTGNQLWKTARDVKISWSSPILVNTGQRQELMLVAEPFVISYDPATGRELWRFNCISGEVGPSLAYADGIVFSVNDYSKLAAVTTGGNPRQLWESDEYLSDIPSPVATAKYVFLPTSYGMMVCYDAKTGTKYWEKDFGTPTYASPVIAGGNVYQLDKKGVMHIFRADQTYSPVAESQLGEGSVCTPAFAGGKIILRGDKNLWCIGK
jgi:outer membrane protein assembly factor BamB